MVRCESGKKRNVYFVSSIVKQLVQANAEKFKVGHSDGSISLFLHLFLIE